ncbi:MAG: hypothetical protein Kow0042_11900 [Calditrichia bacterium]
MDLKRNEKSRRTSGNPEVRQKVYSKRTILFTECAPGRTIQRTSAEAKIGAGTTRRWFSPLKKSDTIRISLNPFVVA